MYQKEGFREGMMEQKAWQRVHGFFIFITLKESKGLIGSPLDWRVRLL